MAFVMNETGARPKRNLLKTGVRLLPVCFALLALGSCTRAQPQIPAQSKQALPAQIPEDWSPYCPSTGAKTGTTDHKVTLTWNASASASPITEIRYCIYRTDGGRVQAVSGKVPVGQVPCTGCELVNQDKKAVKDLFYQDTQLVNGVQYCYAAVAMQKGNPYFSGLSKQVEAEIPKDPAPIPPQISHGPLCDDPQPATNPVKTKKPR